MGNFCKRCIFWAETYRSATRVMGTCASVEAINSIEKDSEDSAEGVLHTEQWFGCIFFRANSMNVVNIKEMANKFVDSIMPKEELKCCELCNALNCINNLTCHKCDHPFTSSNSDTPENPKL